MSASCISRNQINYEFENASLHSEIHDADNPSKIIEQFPRINKRDNIEIESLIYHGDCEEPYISDISHDEKQIKIIISTQSTKSILDKILNPGCKLALRHIGYRIKIYSEEKTVNSVRIITENTAQEDIDVIRTL